MRPLPGRSVIAEFGDRFGADVACARLADAGLESMILGDPAYSVAPHHVTERMFRVVVRDEIADHARRVLSDDRPPDTEAETLDAAFYLTRFADRPTWVRWMTVAVIAAFVGPVTIAATMQLTWIVRGLFP